MPDELHQPLGQSRPHGSGKAGEAGRRGPRPARIVYGLIGAVALTAGGYILKYGDPHGGRPRAMAKIEPYRPPAAALEKDRQPTGTIETRHVERQTAQEVERESGVRVTRAGGGNAPGALIIQLDQPPGVSLAPAPDRRLVEPSRYGALPRIGPDGAMALDVYARPLVMSQKLKATAPRVAIIVGGLGLSSATTREAMEKLPADVSFAFAPYGDDLQAETAQARSRGHEIFLQAPMEPFDYPRNNPGPHTLTVGAPDRDTMDDLRWLMSRFSGYVGVLNFLGARFTAEPEALTPVLRDIAGRGVAFVDDGTSPRSQALAVAHQVGATAARADVVIDADQKREAIDKALDRLERIAHEKGAALGIASAIPQSVELVARFARGLEARGIALVPASAVLAASDGPQAENRRP